VTGGDDSDSLFGDAGNDLMAGGSGFDYIYGGAGADTFDFNVGDSFDSVWDFSAADGDKLRLDPAFGVADFAAFEALLTGFESGGVDYTVLAIGTDQITIGGIAHTAWTAAQLEIA
jgi:Ca2+-binding RTX toxin-like protein